MAGRLKGIVPRNHVRSWLRTATSVGKIHTLRSAELRGLHEVANGRGNCTATLKDGTGMAAGRGEGWRGANGGSVK